MLAIRIPGWSIYRCAAGSERVVVDPRPGCPPDPGFSRAAFGKPEDAQRAVVGV